SWPRWPPAGRSPFHARRTIVLTREGTKRMRHIWLLGALLLTLMTGVAGADDTANQAREHFERGQSLYEESKYLEAAAEFRAGYALKPAAAFLFNEAVCYERLADKGKAVALFQRYLAAAPKAHDRHDV